MNSKTITPNQTAAITAIKAHITHDSTYTAVAADAAKPPTIAARQSNLQAVILVGAPTLSWLTIIFFDDEALTVFLLCMALILSASYFWLRLKQYCAIRKFREAMLTQIGHLENSPN